MFRESAVTGPSEGEGKGGIARSMRRRVDLMCVFAEGVHRTAHSCCIVYLLDFVFTNLFRVIFEFCSSPRGWRLESRTSATQGLVVSYRLDII